MRTANGGSKDDFVSVSRASLSKSVFSALRVMLIIFRLACLSSGSHRRHERLGAVRRSSGSRIELGSAGDYGA